MSRARTLSSWAVVSAGSPLCPWLRWTACRITLIDRRNHYLFQPLLYQVATAALSPADIALPIRSVLRDQRNVTVRLGEVVGVDQAAREVHPARGTHFVRLPRPRNRRSA